MRIVVVVKAVAEADEPPVDRALRRAQREGVALRINPYDARAVRVALERRAPGVPVTALTMGPPAAEIALRESLDAGVDDAIHLVDPRLAGSDALVTSAVLAAAVRRVGAGAVLAGARSIDAETGAVPVQMAERLGWAVVGPLRRLEGTLGVGKLVVDADTDDGWERWSVEPPAVFTVGEKIAKPLHPTEDERAGRAGAPIARWSLADLGIDGDSAGRRGSPTEVVSIGDDAPTRAGRTFAEGPVEDRVRAAFESLVGPGTATPPNGSSRGANGSGRESWVLATGGRGSPIGSARAILSAVRRADPNGIPVAVIAGPAPPADDRAALGRAGARRMLWFPAPDGRADPRAVASALASAVSETPPGAVLLSSDPFSREVAARAAARSGAGLVADVTEFRIGPDGAWDWTKPAFGGTLRAHIRTRGAPPWITVRPGALDPPSDGPGVVPKVERTHPIAASVPGPTRIAEGSERRPELGDLDGARRVVTVGMGIGGAGGIDRLLPYLARWGAALGATRRVVDAGWLPTARQVGLTGRSVAPELAVLLGVGKAANHVAGLRRAGRLVAVNPDPSAPVFRYVDAGIVADWASALPALDAVMSAAR